MNRPSDLNMHRQMLAWGYMHQASTATCLDHTLPCQDGDGTNRAEREINLNTQQGQVPWTIWDNVKQTKEWVLMSLKNMDKRGLPFIGFYLFKVVQCLNRSNFAKIANLKHFMMFYPYLVDLHLLLTQIWSFNWILAPLKDFFFIFFFCPGVTSSSVLTWNMAETKKSPPFSE